MALPMSFSQPLTVLPAKTPFTNTLILRTPCVILRTQPNPSPRRSLRALSEPLLPRNESQKFRTEILKKFSKDKEPFRNDLETVNEFLLQNHACPSDANQVFWSSSLFTSSSPP